MELHKLTVADLKNLLNENKFNDFFNVFIRNLAYFYCKKDFLRMLNSVGFMYPFEQFLSWYNGEDNRHNIGLSEHNLSYVMCLNGVYVMYFDKIDYKVAYFVHLYTDEQKEKLAMFLIGKLKYALMKANPNDKILKNKEIHDILKDFLFDMYGLKFFPENEHEITIRREKISNEDWKKYYPQESKIQESLSYLMETVTT